MMSDVFQTLLQDEETFASTLLIICLDRFGEGMLNGEDGAWTPETLRMEVREAFGVDLSAGNLGKLAAAVSVLTTDNFFRGLPSFLAAVRGLSGDGTDWSYGEPVGLDDLSWAVLEAALLFPPGEDDKFDPQVIAYCREIIRREGLLSPPFPLVFAKDADAYSSITAYDEDVMTEQSGRTGEVDDYLNGQVQRMLAQIESLPLRNAKVSLLFDVLKAELDSLYAENEFR